MRRACAALGATVAMVLVCVPLWAPAAHALEEADRTAHVSRALKRANIASAIVLDPRTGDVLGEKNADRVRPPASLMKMATALMVAARLKPDDELVISRRAALMPADQVQWRIGARFTVDQVLHGMLMMSSNGAAVALAERVSGSVEAFRKEANQMLALIGAPNTRLVDPSGLDAPGQFSTARDLAHIAASVLEYPWLADIVLDRNYQLPWPDGGQASFGNINRYLLEDPSAIGVKNGYTSSAGNCVAAASTRRGRTLIVVGLNGPNVYADTRKIMDAAFGFAPEPSPQRVEVSDAAAQSQASPAPVASAQPSVAATPQAVAAAPVARTQDERGIGMGKLVFVGLLGAYVARVRQVKVRRRRRIAARRRVSSATMTAWPVATHRPSAQTWPDMVSDAVPVTGQWPLDREWPEPVGAPDWTEPADAPAWPVLREWPATGSTGPAARGPSRTRRSPTHAAVSEQSRRARSAGGS